MKLSVSSTSNTLFPFFNCFFQTWFWKLRGYELQLQGRIHKVEHRRHPEVPRSEKGLSMSLLLRSVQKLGQLILIMNEFNSLMLLVCCERVLIAFVRGFNLFWTNSLVLGRITSSVTVFLFPEVFVRQTLYVLVLLQLLPLSVTVFTHYLLIQLQL